MADVCGRNGVLLLLQVFGALLMLYTCGSIVPARIREGGRIMNKSILILSTLLLTGCNDIVDCLPCL